MAERKEALRTIMTPDPVVLDAQQKASEAARHMRDRDVGNVLVQQDGALCGIVTDRDLVVRCLADGAGDRTLAELCTDRPATLAPDASIEEAVALMQERAIRRIPVVDGDKPVGIVSLGDLARARDPQSALGAISDAPATH